MKPRKPPRPPITETYKKQDKLAFLSTMEIQNIDADGNPPERAIPSAAAAHSIYTLLLDNDRNGAYDRAALQNIKNGNAPYSEEDMQRLGMEGLANIDWGEFKASIKKAVSATWSMLVGGRRLISVMPSRTYTKSRRELRWAGIIAKEFSRLHRKKWKSFHYEAMMVLDQMVTFGVGPATREDKYDWRFEAHNTGAVKVSPASKSVNDGQKVVAIRRSKEVSELHEIAKRDKRTGWNSGAVKAALIRFYSDGGMHDSINGIIGSWEDYENQMINQHQRYDKQFEAVPLVHLLVQAAKGGVSHYIFLENDSKHEFLYEAEADYETMDQAFQFIVHGIGEGTYKSVRGRGKDIYSYCNASNQLLNTLLNGALLGSGMRIGANESDLSQIHEKILFRPPFVFSTKDITLEPNNTMQSLSAAADVRRLLQNQNAFNVGEYMSGVQRQAKTPETAAKVQQDAQLEQQYSDNDADFIHHQWSEILCESFRRLLAPGYPANWPGRTERDEFIQRCVDQGVPPELLKYDAWDVEATRNFGGGSQVMGEQIARKIVDMAGALKESERRRAVTQYVGMLTNWAFDLDDDPEDAVAQTDQVQEAVKENVLMQTGSPIPVGEMDDDVTHLVEHMRDITNMIQQVAGGNAQVEQALPVIETKIGHAYAHVSAMAEDYYNRDSAPAMKAQVDRVAESLAPMRKAYEDAIRQRQAQQALQEEQVQKLAERADEQAHEIELKKIESAAAIERYRIDKVEVLKVQGLNDTRDKKIEAQIEALIKTTDAKLEKMYTDMIAKIDKENADAPKSAKT
jgi:hypothetical protein